MPIEALPLCQPEAPALYLVEAPLDTERRVSWDGLRWSCGIAPGESGSVHVDTALVDTPAKDEAAPVFDTAPGVNEPPTQPSPTHAQVDGPSASPPAAPVARRPRLARRVAKRADRPGEERAPFSSMGSPAARAAHAALDKARDRYGRAIATNDFDQAPEALDAYAAAITAVDQADPGFYLGRYNPLAPLPFVPLPVVTIPWRHEDLTEIAP